MRIVLFQLTFWLVLLRACSPVFGQQAGALLVQKVINGYDTTFFYFYRQDTVLWLAPTPKPHNPEGDIRLRRFRWTTLNLEPVAVRDTLSLLLVSKSATPFKKIQWAGETTVQHTVFRYRDTVSRTLPHKLKIKPRCSLKRQVATLSLQTIGPRRPIQVTDTREVQIRKHPHGQPDTIVRRYRAVLGKSPVLIDTSYSVTALDTLGSTRRHRSTQLVLKTRAYKADTLLPKGTFLVPRLRKKVIRYNGFQKGDTVFFDIKVAGKTPLRSIVLKDHRKLPINSAIDALVFADTLCINDEPYLDLYLTGTPAWKKQKVTVKVWRIRPSVVDSFHTVKDTVYMTRDSVRYDTLAVTVKDDSLQLAPVLDISSKPPPYLGRMEIEIAAKLPNGFRLVSIAYWVGVGATCLADYQTIEKTIPPNWSLPGAPIAIGALGNGHPIFLPHIGTADVAMVFNLSGKPIAPKETASVLGLSLVKNACVVPVHEFDEVLKPDPKSGLYRFFACFNNKSTDVAYPVQVKMVAFYRKEKSRQPITKKVSTTSVTKKLSEK